MESSEESVLDRRPEASRHSAAARISRDVRLEDVLITDELAGRSMRPRSFDAENRALFALAEELALRPENLLNKLAQIILALCDGGSAGVSVLEPGVSGRARMFRFRAIAGRCAAYVDRLYPNDANPCGAALQAGGTLLFDRPGRHFLDLASFDPPIYECLVTPILFDGEPIGTLWSMAHSRERRFDAEDARLLESLSRFAAAGYRTTKSLLEATAARDESQRRVEELARAHEALRESERNFRAIFELAGSGKAQADPSTHRFTAVNRKFCEITGYEERELLGMTWADLTHPEDVDSDWPSVLAVLRGEKPTWTREKRYVRKDGQIVWVMVSGSAIRNSAGEPTSMIATITDVTSRRLAENAVRESEERYRAIVESQTEMICRFRTSGEIRFVNGAYARSRGTTPEALLSQNFWDFVVEADRPFVRETLETLSAEAPETRIENRFRTVDGERWTLWTNRALSFDDAGRPLELQATGVDVTELRAAQEALQAADKRKDEFLAMLGHELRNPLAPIRSGLQLLEMEGSSESDRRETVAVMGGQVDHLVRLVDDLLDVSRIVRGRIALQRQPVDLNQVVRRAREVVAQDVRSREQTLSIDLPGEPLWTDGDPVRLAQVLENLLVNASKYNVIGGRIDVSARREGNEHVVRIRDTGIGIDPELLPTIFELFTQSRRSLDRAQGGLGLGLALVQNLIALHGGEVSVHSEGRDQGSEFTVRLPATETPVTPQSQPASAKSSRGKRTLLVDDNAAALFVLKKLVTKLGPHEVETAADGPSALVKAKAFRPEIAMLDIGLPGMNGFDVARQMRADPDLAGVKLIALTGYGQEEDRRQSEAAGFDCHLVKPVSIDDLRTLLAD